MTLAELDDSLPHGFHDSRWDLVSIDYTIGNILIDVDLWIGEKHKDEYRKGRLHISGVAFQTIEDQPTGKWLYAKPKPMTLEACALPETSTVRYAELKAKKLRRYTIEDEDKEIILDDSVHARLEWTVQPNQAL